ncbi:hypothetical protein JL720_12656 [Aureococcus anophagefferens]|nr:hypothetical protein JL720_12656 [Aureococcus anophagefferens]
MPVRDKAMVAAIFVLGVIAVVASSAAGFLQTHTTLPTPAHNAVVEFAPGSFYLAVTATENATENTSTLLVYDGAASSPARQDEENQPPGSAEKKKKKRARIMSALGSDITVVDAEDRFAQLAAAPSTTTALRSSAYTTTLRSTVHSLRDGHLAHEGVLPYMLDILPNYALAHLAPLGWVSAAPTNLYVTFNGGQALAAYFGSWAAPGAPNSVGGDNVVFAGAAAGGPGGANRMNGLPRAARPSPRYGFNGPNGADPAAAARAMRGKPRFVKCGHCGHKKHQKTSTCRYRHVTCKSQQIARERAERAANRNDTDDDDDDDGPVVAPARVRRRGPLGRPRPTAAAAAAGRRLRVGKLGGAGNLAGWQSGATRAHCERAPRTTAPPPLATAPR